MRASSADSEGRGGVDEVELMQSKGKNRILAAVLMLYPLRHAMTGADLMDAGYALTNYCYFNTVNETWKLATYLANVAGRVLLYLPSGDTWTGMNVYTGLLIGMTAAFAFLFFARRCEDGSPAIKYLLFFAELSALSLCWAPSVILYHYLGYLLMTAASLLLFTAITKDNKWYFIAAGAVCGLCVAVRMPNITYMAFILPVWYFWFQERKRDGAWPCRLAGRTGICAVGYLAGLLVPAAWICLRYGVHAYPRMITSLFGMTETAADYKPASMVTAMSGDYLEYSIWLLLFLAYMAAGTGALALAGLAGAGKHGRRITAVFKTLYLVGFFVLLRLCYARGMFDFDYTAYFSMYKWVTVYLLVTLLLCAGCLVSREAPDRLKLWAVFVIVTIWITPLGSNNRLYPIINNLFVVAPVSVLLAAGAFRRAKAWRNGFAFRAVLCFVFLCTAFQGILFGAGFVFHDALPAGEERAALSLQCSGRADGLRTTAEKKGQLEALDRFLAAEGLSACRVILFGQVPALSYLFDMEPALSSAWPDLDSYSPETLEAQLDGLTAGGRLPVIIFGRTFVESLDDTDSSAYRKFAAIRDFAAENGYGECFRNEGFIVLAVLNDPDSAAMNS